MLTGPAAEPTPLIPIAQASKQAILHAHGPQAAPKLLLEKERDLNQCDFAGRGVVKNAEVEAGLLV